VWLNLPRPAPAPTPPDPVADLAEKLQTRRPVTLAARQGAPVYARWALGQGGLNASPDEPGAFALEVFNAGYLELAPDPQSESFRFEAEILHTGIANMSEVGLYVMHHKEGPAHRQFNYVATWTYAEHGPMKGRALLYTRKHQRIADNDQLSYDLSKMRKLDKKFVPKAGVWRHLAVEVTPEKVTVFFDGKQQGQVPQPKMTDPAFTFIKGQDGKEMPVLDKTFPPLVRRGGVGLYLSRGRAVFRNIQIHAF
jgi:hypothetical protein